MEVLLPDSAMVKKNLIRRYDSVSLSVYERIQRARMIKCNAVRGCDWLVKCRRLSNNVDFVYARARNRTFNTLTPHSLLFRTSMEVRKKVDYQ